MKRRFLISITILLIGSILFTGPVFAESLPKVDVCHATGNGSYHLINISENALQAHKNHGDGRPGELVPGVSGKKFAEDCTLVDANANVAGTWRGQSGYTGVMGYWFDMTLTQDPAGNVTGTIDYDIGIVRIVNGTVSLYEFTFTTSGGTYWADCTPCIVSIEEDYLHGYGTHSLGGGPDNIEWEATKQ